VSSCNILEFILYNDNEIKMTKKCSNRDSST